MSLLTIPELAVIRRMLRANIRHTEIARRLGLPVETVTRVATSRRIRRRKLHLLTDEDLPEGDAPPDYLAANLRRCEGCGGMVYHWPCLACCIRDAQSAGIVLPVEEDADCIAATRGRGDDEGESGGEGEWETNDRFSFCSVSRSPPLPLSPSLTPTETSHAHA